jgi:Family of unknown function (DUF6788)
VVKHGRVSQARDRVVASLPDLRQIVRGSLFKRTIRHRQGCPKCEAGEGHPMWIFTVGYRGGRTRQLSLRAEQVPQVRDWLANYRKSKAALEKICELNQHLLRPESPRPRARRIARD